MEKKEIGKLLELLNEYHHFNSDLIGYFYDEEYEKFYFRTELPEERKSELRDVGFTGNVGINEEWIENEWICSKRFGFIQRLVEHDKIDLDKEIKNSELNWLHEKYLREDCLLMLLSISEQPIELLCQILK